MSDGQARQEPPRIEIRPNGPFRVTGSVPLRREEIVRSPDGHSVEWRVTDEFPLQHEYLLCRCGRSENKPFCDDSHLLEPPFDGTETADPTPTAERRRELRTQQLVVGDDGPLCSSIGFCVSRTGDVWGLLLRARDPEIRSRIIRMIQHCPSGRLTYSLPPDSKDVEQELEPSISAVGDGPLWVKGRVEVIGADGVRWEVRNRDTICRCGASKNKPFCDGRHSAVGFRDPAEDSAVVEIDVRDAAPAGDA
jgi:CDGSH-type Zn-finger protein